MSPAAGVPRVRSALFAPGHRRDFLEKLESSGADAAILDLEDAVPRGEGARARREVARWLAGRPRERRPLACVRVNPLSAALLEQELAAVVTPGLLAVLLPKLEAPDEVRALDAALARAEARAGLREGAVRLWPIVETAAAVRAAYEIATASPRVAYMGGSAGDGGDLAHAIGFRWSPDFTETLYIRSKVLVDVRAAGVENPMSGVVTRLDDPGEVEALARQSRQLGYAGMMVIHPAHVPVVNAVFRPSEDELTQARRLIAAMDRAEGEGEGAIELDGRMVDAAMVRAARAVLDEAALFEEPGG